MSYESDAADLSGREHNVWGSIYRAFRRLDKGINPVLICIDMDQFMDSCAHVFVQRKNDHGNQVGGESRREKQSLRQIKEILTDLSVDEEPEEGSFMEFLNNFDKNHINEKFVYLSDYDDTLPGVTIWRILRLDRSCCSSFAY